MDKKNQGKSQRPPIVVVLGHVDHGKTTLLDYIRKANVAEREAGGITQSMGAYEMEHNKRKLTFIDTPGHEAFSKMRSRGAAAADIAILIVAADDGVKPQTKEAIQIIQDAKIPFVVAINKIDRDSADVNRVKNDLAASNVLLEGYGGNISFQAISAKTGEGVPELLDLILLAAEFEDLSFDAGADPSGFIFEAKRDSRRGVAVSGIITNGTLKVGDEIVAGEDFAKIKSLENFLGERVKEAVPSMPVMIFGFDSLPSVGDRFLKGEKQKAALPSVAQNRTAVMPTLASQTSINLILKADVSGSLEALTELVQNLTLPETATIKIVDASVGDITDGDVKLAVSSSAMIIGFKVSIAKTAENFVKSQRVTVITSSIIYELIEAIEKRLTKTMKESDKSILEILGVFGVRGKNQVIGGKVLVGTLKNESKFDVERNGEIVGSGRIINLQSGKNDALKVEAENECGLLADADVDIVVGDRIVTKE
ncbi:MAG: translation initiation factor IF-2 [Candidatus Harrisonbacteria bacterium CG10_big_fil_rev_8_21_14_0_10_40_38]|uniref:Translation initiation factor IF-2 n=1 Tax=Candidatus Harrisonbacteria bacterium CG10_big_fil_rev_8_21_14_0_10_40_38 TaxID=1974583 RepID=A0A2H0URZ7_9BACT|nr:MAG: translation initiation factor IF-2 [Candidatus Harrisonbacteria bacterium CG10_big_fil_rev_8_21_14_0_10_40_38]